MKYVLFAALLFASQAQANVGASVSGTTISWPNTGGWMQVQDSSDYSTVCEGVISTCTVSAGTYQVIDHSFNTRQRNVVVSGPSAQSNANTPTNSGSSGVSIYTQHQSCDFDSTIGQITGINKCAAHCHSNDIPIGMRACQGHGSISYLSQNSFQQSGKTWLSCNAHVNAVPAVQLLNVTMEISCLKQ